MNKHLNKMRIFIQLENNKQKLNIIKWEDVKKHGNKENSNGYSDNNVF